MITKMKKLTFLIHNGEYEGFLEQLRSLGVVHVIQKQQGAVQDAALQEDIALLGRCKAALKDLEVLSGNAKGDSPHLHCWRDSIILKLKKRRWSRLCRP